MTTSHHTYVRSALFAFCLMSGLPVASAATLTWVGGNANWNNNSNWSPSGTFPLAVDSIAGATSATTLNLNSGGTVGAPVDITRAVTNFTYASASNWVLLGDDYGTSTLAVSGTLEKGGAGTWDFQSNSVGTNRFMAVTAGYIKVTGGAMNLGGYNNNGKELKSLVSGTTEISGGILRVATSATGTINYSLGALTMTSGTLVLNAKAASSTAATTGTVNGLAGTGGGVILASDPAISGTSTLVIATSSTTSSDAILADGAGVLSVVKTGAGQQILLGASAYTGTSAVTGGVLAVSSLTNGGVASSIGASGSSAGNLVLDGGALSYIGVSATTNRLFTVGTAGATLAANGTGAITFSNTGSLVLSGSGARALALGGTNAGTNTLAVAIGDGTGGTTSLIKSGAGKWVLTGSNGFTGATTVSDGTLRVAGANALAGTSSVTVAAGGLLQISAANSVNDSAGITLSGGTISRDGGISERFGDLNLTTASTLDFGTGAIGSLAFGLYTPTYLLTVSNFAEGDSLVFHSDLTSVFAGNYNSKFNFGGSGILTAWDGSNFTITSVPEPSTIVAGGTMLALLLWPRRLLSRLAVRKP